MSTFLHCTGKSKGGGVCLCVRGTLPVMVSPTRWLRVFKKLRQLVLFHWTCTHARIKKRIGKRCLWKWSNSIVLIYFQHNQFNSRKGSRTGENNFIKEVLKVSRSLIKNHILLGIWKPWRARWEHGVHIWPYHEQGLGWRGACSQRSRQRYSAMRQAVTYTFLARGLQTVLGTVKTLEHMHLQPCAEHWVHTLMREPPEQYLHSFERQE